MSEPAWVDFEEKVAALRSLMPFFHGEAGASGADKDAAAYSIAGYVPWLLLQLDAHREALHKSWKYDEMTCSVCHGGFSIDTERDYTCEWGGLYHQPSCLVLSLGPDA